ncbi:iron uptake transporter deferrochelatase/peroxidase subunit [Streptacidiphilus sp. P02-A3a]|uniref:iron uptake transporter deferrochelatase/peroxidase subunit n=1 Tax=Streptacidiphilus sp. P02-A3a TaxID=2704468 RepID=UPI0015F7F898|nr:iron uptake transporter deferrochelatase/peroxidase subunit [Streptacidiphilus sp. P02-A3a]QMU66935.1 deferrochelatase/peroxidase EfeB [Streptacidiphilus sp. P02-A3a]
MTNKKKRGTNPPNPPRTTQSPAADPAADPGRTPVAGSRGRVSRRRLLTTAGGVGAVGLAVGVTAYAVSDSSHADASDAGTAAAGATPLTALGADSVPFYGAHQGGIVQPMQARMYTAAFDLTPGTGRPGLTSLMKRWSAAAAAMAEGRTPPGVQDTDVALDAGPSSLTVTFGFGAPVFAKAGLGGQLPQQLAPLPVFASDALVPGNSDGDLWVQVCADDGLVAFHALRTLQGLAAGTAAVRWQMSGFSRSPGATARPRTGRNLMGQIDGTNNPKPTDAAFDSEIFVPAKGSPAWMAGGSYVVFRRIRMLLDSWEQQSLTVQERVIGRHKASGAPLSGGTETTAVQLDKLNPDGSLAIPGDAHIRVAAAQSNQGAAMLRRGYSYADGFRPGGAPDAGLLFVAFQADPLTGFVPVQRKLTRGDALSRFIVHESSGLYAAPGGAASADGYVGQALLES